MGKARAFDDVFSFLHFLAAALSVILGVETAATIAYVFYQFIERESLRRKLGDAVEWITGLIAGGIVRALLAG